MRSGVEGVRVAGDDGSQGADCPGDAPPRKAFGAVTQLSTPAGPGEYHFEPAAALAKDGSVTAVYIATSVMRPSAPVFGNVLGVSTLSGVGTKNQLNGDRTLKGARQNHFDPWMATDRKGTLYAVVDGFRRRSGSRAQHGDRHRQEQRRGQRSQPVAAHDAAADCPDNAPGCFDKPMVAIGPDRKQRRRDAIYVFYYSGPGGGLKMTKSVDGGATFGKSVLVGESAYGDAEVDQNGVIHVVLAYASPATGPFGDSAGAVMYTRSDDGGASFSKPVKVSAEGEPIPFYFSNPQVVADTRRKRVYVVYPTGTPDGKWDIKLATKKGNAASWSRIKVNDDATCANHMTPTIALDRKTGATHVVWTENRGGSGRVAMPAVTAAAPAAAPTSR